MGLRDAEQDRERRDLVTHQVMDESRLIRFVAAPDGSVAPDLARKLPGRGLWVAADRASIETAVKKNLFSRAAKAPMKPAADLADTVESLLVRRCLDQLGLARREGVLISGFEKSLANIRAGKTSISRFSDAELDVVQRVWQRVAEDFSMFNIDVTTEDPGVEALRKTIRAL